MSAFTDIQLQMLFGTIEVLFVAGAVLMALITREKDKHSRVSSWIKYISYFFIIHIIVCSIIFHTLPFLVLFSVVSIVAVVEVLSTPVRSGQMKKKPVSMLLFMLFFCIVIGFFTGVVLKTAPVKLITIYLLVAILDAFSQLTGQLLGRHKLAPAISPNKTVEGLIGGLAVCTLTTVLLRANLSLAMPGAVVFGLLLGCAGSAGDLFSSLYKRKNGIKDYNSLLPGQGGVMDRFVSFFFAAAAAGLFFHLGQVAG